MQWGLPGKISAPCMIRGASAAKRDPPWQDLRAMHSRKAICGAFRMHGAHILPKPARFGYMAAICCQEGALFPSEAPSGMHEARKLPRIAARGRIAREYCRCQSPENAFRAYPAIAGRLGMHSVDTLPLADIRECTASAYRHCQLPVTQRSPREGVGSGPWLRCGVWRTILSVRGSGHSVSSGLNCWERFRVCAVSVGNHELASRSAKLCRIMC